MHDKSSRFWLAQSLVVLLCINGNAQGRRVSRSLELQRVVESGNLFAEDVYHVLIKPANEDFNSTIEDKNMLISPLSIDIALAMVMAGTTGNTEKEISNALRLGENMKEPEIHKGYHDLITSLRDNSNEEGGVRLQIANRIYVGQLYPIKPSFLHTIRQNYFADAEQINFEDTTKAANTVNNWVREATRNRITDIISPTMLDKQALMILVNAIHFKGEWKFPFDPEATSEGHFTTITGSKVPVKMMRLDRPHQFQYARLPELRSSAIALPYISERYSLVILLPERGHSLKDVEARIQDGTLSRIPTRLRSALVDVRMPKILLESNVDLIASKVVENLGMSSITSQLAEFDKLTDEKGVRITSAIHKAFMDINEAGSEAAAVTAFVAHARSLNVDPAIKFVVDRPFIAYIYDSKTKSILFVARKIV